MRKTLPKNKNASPATKCKFKCRAGTAPPIGQEPETRAKAGHSFCHQSQNRKVELAQEKIRGVTVPSHPRAVERRFRNQIKICIGSTHGPCESVVRRSVWRCRHASAEKWFQKSTRNLYRCAQATQAKHARAIPSRPPICFFVLRSRERRRVSPPVYPEVTAPSHPRLAKNDSRGIWADLEYE